MLWNWRLKTQQRRKEKCSGQLLQEKREHSDWLLQEEQEHVLEQPEDVCGFCGILSLQHSQCRTVGLQCVVSQYNFFIAFAGLKSHNLSRIERWRRFGATRGVKGSQEKTTS